MRLLTAVVLLVAGWPSGAPAQGTFAVANAGLKTPESALYDANRDVYYVSNINGVPSAKDNNGFISVVTPDGQVKALEWIRGGRAGVTLHAPKGLALAGDTLVVTDIDCVRRFRVDSGAPAGETCVPGATFLNDVDASPDGTLYVSDTGIRIDASGVQPTGTDAVYRIGADGTVTALAKGPELNRPNGVAWADGAVYVVGFGGKELARLEPSGTRAVVATLPAGQLDGLLRLPDGSFVISSWEGQALYRVPPGGGRTTTMAEKIPSPADLGFDSKRRRVLVPVFTEDRLVGLALP